MSRWTSNATWLHLKGAKAAQKRAKRERHVVLARSHVALALQRDVAPPQRCQNCLKGSKTSAPRRIGPPPCLVGLPTRRGYPTSDSIILRQALINGGVIILVAGMVTFMEWVEVLSQLTLQGTVQLLGSHIVGNCRAAQR